MNGHRKKKNWLEWSVFTLGLLLVVSLVGYLVYDMWTANSGPPRIVVELGDPTQQGGYFLLPVDVKNRGHQVAEQVHVEVKLVDQGQTEVAEFVVQFLPRDATRHGTVTFTIDPRDADQVTPRVLGYQRP